jgi:hypothetical protein
MHTDNEHVQSSRSVYLEHSNTIIHSVYSTM